MSNARSQPGFLSKLTPGLANLLNYQRSNLSHDLIAGLSVAVALPVGVAYTQLAGFNLELATRFRKAQKIQLSATLGNVMDAFAQCEGAKAVSRKKVSFTRTMTGERRLLCVV